MTLQTRLSTIVTEFLCRRNILRVFVRRLRIELRFQVIDALPNTSLVTELAERTTGTKDIEYLRLRKVQAERSVAGKISKQ
jgi:hypothetical protein